MTFEAAEARKIEMLSDPGFTEKYLQGDVASRREFTRVHEALANGAPVGPDQFARETEIAHLRSRADINDTQVKEYVERWPQSAKIVQEARDLRQRLFADRAWVERYLSGGREEARQVALLGIILTAPLAEEQQKGK
jgi:hypothetical protein